jgi:hypothetical protein
MRYLTFTEYKTANGKHKQVMYKCFLFKVMSHSLATTVVSILPFVGPLFWSVSDDIIFG